MKFADCAGMPTTAKETKGRKEPRLLYGPFKRVSPYGLFFTENHADIRKSNPSAAFGEVSKMVGAMWRGSTEDVKNSYRHRVRAAKEFYMKAMESYMSHPKNASDRYKRSKRGNFRDDVKCNVFTFPESSFIHTNEQNASTDEEVCTNLGNTKTLECNASYDIKGNKGASSLKSMAVSIEEKEACPTPTFE